MKKYLIPVIYLYNKMAVSGFNDKTVIETNPERLINLYCENGADEILIFDLSDDDMMHEEHIDLIHELCALSTVPIIGAGRVLRMEDIKKLLYAGCKRACLNFSKEGNVKLLREVSLKFGADKIIPIILDADEYVDNYKDILDYSKSVLFLDRDVFKSEKISKNTSLRFIVNLPNVLLDKLLEYLNEEKIVGVCGPVINSNINELKNIKELAGIRTTSFKEFKLNSDGLIPVIVQDYKSNQVLMLAYMNEEAYNNTLSSGKMNYFSRSRQTQWLKGETSGHFQYLKALSYDCDNDTLLAKVEQIGAACHTGSYSCFFNDIVTYDFEEKNPSSVLEDVYDVIMDRKKNPKEGSYTNYLFDKGIDKILKKVGEEATEIVIAAKNPNPNEVKYEISDFLYHVMVLMAEKGVTWDEIFTELSNR